MSDDNKEPKGDKKKKKRGLIPIIILIILVAIGATLYLNRSKVGEMVKDIPVLNRIFKVEAGSDDPYEGLSPEALKEKLKETQTALETEQLKVAELENEAVLLQEKIDALKTYEENYNAFMTQKNEWDAELARNNPELFIKQFESFYPEQAANLYSELKGNEVLSKEQQELAKTIVAMDSGKAAQTLQELFATDTELVKMILENMKSDQQASILNEMDVATAAQIIKLIAPAE